MPYFILVLGLLQIATILFMRYAGKWLVPRPYGKDITGIARHPVVSRLLLWSSALFSVFLIVVAFQSTAHGWWFLGGSAALFLLFTPPPRSFFR